MNTFARQGTTLPFKRGIGLLYAVSVLIAILVSIVSFAGFFSLTWVYPSDELRQTFVPNDLVNLVLGVPALLFSLWLAYRRRWLGVFFWTGALIYVLYNYLAYLFAVPLSLPFLIYLVLVMLSPNALLGLLANLDGELVQQRLHHNVPEKFSAAVLIGLGSVFFLRALGVILTAAVGRNAIPTAELAVNIADFLITPAWVIGGFQLWRKNPLGYVVGLGLLFQASLLFVALIIVMIYQPVLTKAPLAFTDLAVIFALGLICFIPFVRYVGGVKKQEDRRDSGTVLIPFCLRLIGGCSEMNRKAFFTKLVVVIGTMLVWLPLLAPLLLSLVLWLKEKIFRFDYLMPAELFVFVLAGGLLLLWAAWRAHSRLKPIAWGLGVAAGMLVGGQAIAVATGLASGAREPAGWAWNLVLTSLTVFWLALILLCFGAVGLLIDLMRPAR